MKTPRANNMMVRRNILGSSFFLFSLRSSLLPSEYEMDAPTMKRKKGKKMSARVKPFQSACTSNG